MALLSTITPPPQKIKLLHIILCESRCCLEKSEGVESFHPLNITSPLVLVCLTQMETYETFKVFKQHQDGVIIITE